MSNPVYSAPLDLITTAVLDLLRGTGRPWFDGAYDGDPTAPDFWYGLLYRLPGGNSDVTPDLDANPQTITVPYQATAVGGTRNQAERAGGITRDRLLARAPTGAGWLYPLAMPTGWACTYRAPDPAMPGIDRAGDPPTAIYSLPFRFAITVAPA